MYQLTALFVGYIQRLHCVCKNIYLQYKKTAFHNSNLAKRNNKQNVILTVN